MALQQDAAKRCNPDAAGDQHHRGGGVLLPGEVAAQVAYADAVAGLQAVERLLEGAGADARGHLHDLFAGCRGEGEPAQVVGLFGTGLGQDKCLVLPGGPGQSAVLEDE
ncbi:hypothetical protein D3C75_1107670 [compost metagenome]